MRKLEDVQPYALRDIIKEEWQDMINNNLVDYRQTSQSTLDEIYDDYIVQYNNGVEIKKNISPDDLSKCSRLYESNGYRRPWYELCHWRIDDKRVLIERYVTMIDEVRKLKKIFS